MSDYLSRAGSRTTPQSEPIPGSSQVPNNAGGHAWPVDAWTRARRFLILGSEGGSYYATEADLTRENADAVRELVNSDGVKLVEEIVAISDAGRAPSNDPALFALAMAAKEGDLETRRAAYEALPAVARIGTHLFHFATYLEAFGGWGRAAKRAVAAWYQRDPEQVAFQAVKYRQRDGWSHRDLLRLAHPKAPSPAHRAIYAFIAGNEDGVSAEYRHANDGPTAIIESFRRAQAAETPEKTAALVRELGLPREALRTEHLKSPEVWEAMLETGMPTGALIRNLANLTRAGIIGPMAQGNALVVTQLTDQARLRRSRIHPLVILNALATYNGGGRFGRSRGEAWKPEPSVVDALSDAFHLSFEYVEPANKRTMLAIDVSGSMTWPENSLSGLPALTARDGAAAMAMVTAATEPAHMVTAFSDRLEPVSLSPRERLDAVIRKLDEIRMGATDCALPMIQALEEKIEVDTFIVYTDNETGSAHGRGPYGRTLSGIHPAQALREYREKTGIPARLIVVGMASNGFSIADPNDAGMLDVVGFDSAAPNVMSAFSRGDL